MSLKNDGFFISTGDKSGFYTLKQLVLEPVYTKTEFGNFPSGVSEKEVFYQNLSTDKDEAIAKAKQITGLTLNADFTLEEITRLKAEEYAALRAERAEYLATQDWSIFHFGKYTGKSVSEVFELDQQYVLWVAGAYFSSEEAQLTQTFCKAAVAPVLAAREAARAAASDKVIAAFGREWLADNAANCVEGFLKSVSADLLAGISVSPRGILILTDIKCKQAGRRNSKAYAAAYESITGQVPESCIRY